jgi:hypothetical protein
MDAKTIFNEIQGLNPSTSTISSLGTFVSEQNQQVADSIRVDVMTYLPKKSLAYKILMDADTFSSKQLWSIAYELLKNEEYCQKLTSEIADREKRFEYQKARKKAEHNANIGRRKVAEQIVEEHVDKLAGIVLGDRVRHDKFGEGNVVSDEDNKLIVRFDEYGDKMLLKKFVKLEKI